MDILMTHKDGAAQEAIKEFIHTAKTKISEQQG